MRRFLRAVPIVCLLILCMLVGTGCLCRPRYSIRIYHGPASPAAKSSWGGMLYTVGRVMADDPEWKTNRWYAWVVVADRDGTTIEDPDVTWTTDIPQCIALCPVADRPDCIDISAYPGSQVGRGRVYADFNGVTDSIDMVCYGRLELAFLPDEHMSDGWSFADQSVVPWDRADLYAAREGESYPPTWHAPYGIQARSQWDDPWAFLDSCTEPVAEGFCDTVVPDSSIVYEVISKDGTHYRVSRTGGYVGPDGQRLFMAWAPFW